MYVIINKNRVVIGALPWNATYFTRVIQSRHRVLLDIPADEPSPESFPMTLTEDWIIKRAVEQEKQPLNPYVEEYYGPQWDISGDEAVAVYKVRDLPLDHMKTNFYGLFANERYTKETSGAKITIGDEEYSLPTDRESRNAFVLAAMNLQEDQTINWKFKEGWVELTKASFDQVLATLNTHVQQAFANELDKTQRVLECETKQQLLDLDLLPKKRTEFE